MKKLLSILIAIVMLLPMTAFAQDSVAQQKPTITFTQSLYLIKGKHEYIPIENVDNETKLSFKSSNEKVATVTKKGEIKAKKCGKSTITVNITKDNCTYKTKINVTVAISRNRITKVYGKQFERVDSADSRPVTKLPVAVKVGKTTTLKVSNLVDTDELKYLSSDEKIATIDENGKITAKKAGTAIITAVVKRDGKNIRCKQKIKAVKSVSDSKITKKERNKYYSTSAFIGSSIGVGQKMYFNSQGKGYLGNPLMLVRGCYSFNNDKNHNTKYMIQYKGVAMRAKDAVHKSGVNKVFVAMGTNDLFQGVNTTYKQYIDYIEGIKKKSPKVIIFVESMTSVHASKQKKQLNSKNVAKLNKKLKEYCDNHKDYYYVDVSSKMNDKNGHLMGKYSSDNYVHLTNSAYELWMNELTSYTDKLMINEQNAQDAVKTAVESKDADQIAKAKKALKKLDSSSFKSKLKKQLKEVE